MNAPTASNSEARKRHSPGVQIEGGDPAVRIAALEAENARLSESCTIHLMKRSEVEAEVARLTHLLGSHVDGRSREDWIGIALKHIGRANAAEVERDALAATVERVRALAGEWESEAAEVVIDMGGCKRWSEIHASGIRGALEVQA